MNEPLAESQQAIYSIGATSRMVGLEPVTIRNWEKRYHLVQPQRSAGGQRLYSRRDVECLLFLKRRLDEGMNAGQAHRLLATNLEAGRPVSPEPEPEAPRLLILLVERDPLAAELTEHFLRTEGYQIELAFSAGDATDKFEQLLPQLVIVDLLISGGSGAALCRELKGRGAAAVVALSMLATRDEALRAGADAFHQKPVDPLQLVSTVNDLVGRSALVRASSRHASGLDASGIGSRDASPA
jgi:CheY-like chemotaxis protein